MKDLVGELKGFRRGRGLTLPKLMASSLIGRFPDVAAFEQFTGQLGNSKEAQALYNAYGFGWNNPWTLTRRRNEFAVDIANQEGRVPYSVDAVELWENQSIRELAVLLTGKPVEEDEEDLDDLLEVRPLTAEELAWGNLVEGWQADHVKQEMIKFLDEAAGQWLEDRDRFMIRKTIWEDMRDTFDGYTFRLPPRITFRKRKATLDHWKQVVADSNKLAEQLRAEALALDERKALLLGMRQVLLEEPEV